MLTVWVRTDDTEMLIGVDDEITREEVATDHIFVFTLLPDFSSTRILAPRRCPVAVPSVSLTVFDQC